MILGMSTALFTKLHVLISLIGIFSGLVVIFLMIANKTMTKVTALFLVTTILTSVTGFFFPFHGMTPGIAIGILSLVILLLTLIALHAKKLAGAWRGVYVITAVLAEFFNCLVLVVQSFQKIPALHKLAPTGTETPQKLVQILLVVVMIVLGTLAFKKYKPCVVVG